MGPIVHVVQHLRPGGLEVMALELARVQAQSRPAVVLSLDGNPRDARLAWPRLADVREPLFFLDKKPGLTPSLVASLVGVFRLLRPSCVHTHHVGPLLYAGIAARLAGVPRILHTEHDAWHLSDPGRRRLVRGALMLARPLVIADAPHVADAFSAALGRPRPVVVLNGVDTGHFTSRPRLPARIALGLPTDVHVVGVAARLEVVKGVDIAIEALALIPGTTVLAIAGVGSERVSLERRAAELGISGRVFFLGLTDDMAGFYAALDLLCVPSRNEGLPLAPLEAQSCGIPVVACRVGGVPAAVCPLTGILVPGESPRDLADGITRALAQELRGDPRSFVLKEASLAASAAAYLALLPPG